MKPKVSLGLQNGKKKYGIGGWANVCKTQTSNIAGDLVKCPPSSCTIDENYQVIQAGRKEEGLFLNSAYPERHLFCR